jgi:hypothetical protein
MRKAGRQEGQTSMLYRLQDAHLRQCIVEHQVVYGTYGSCLPILLKDWIRLLFLVEVARSKAAAAAAAARNSMAITLLT